MTPMALFCKLGRAEYSLFSAPLHAIDRVAGRNLAEDKPLRIGLERSSARWTRQATDCWARLRDQPRPHPRRCRSHPIALGLTAAARPQVAPIAATKPRR
jgi:hypothetical protein